jgi:hypothetical protein
MGKMDNMHSLDKLGKWGCPSQIIGINILQYSQRLLLRR